MMQGMRAGLTPAQFDASAAQAGYKTNDRAVRHILLVQGYDNLISNGFVTRSDVYLSVPPANRTFVADIARRYGRYWAPGRRHGLHASIRREMPVVPPFDLEVCVRYGPIESLYGDLYANLRRYELLLWGLLLGFLREQHGGDDQVDWRNSGWWKEGVPEAERKSLVGDWSTRTDCHRPWQLADLGTMLKMLDVKPTGRRLAEVNGDANQKEFASEVRKVEHVRNAVMHPLGGRDPQEPEFVLVTDALRSLVGRAQNAKASGVVAPSITA